MPRWWNDVHLAGRPRPFQGDEQRWLWNRCCLPGQSESHRPSFSLFVLTHNDPLSRPQPTRISLNSSIQCRRHCRLFNYKAGGLQSRNCHDGRWSRTGTNWRTGREKRKPIRNQNACLRPTEFCNNKKRNLSFVKCETFVISNSNCYFFLCYFVVFQI